jgi:hypothetical protein
MREFTPEEEKKLAEYAMQCDSDPHGFDIEDNGKGCGVRVHLLQTVVLPDWKIAEALGEGEAPDA